jgi:hypothetical protein
MSSIPPIRNKKLEIRNNKFKFKIKMNYNLELKQTDKQVTEHWLSPILSYAYDKIGLNLLAHVNS